MKKFIALSAMVMFCAAFAGCSKESTPGEKLDAGINAAEKKIDEATKK